MVEFANIANLRLNFGPGLAQAGLTNEARQLREEQAKSEKLRSADIEDARDLIIGGTEEEQEKGLLLISSLQGPAVSNAMRATLERADERELAEGLRKTDAALKKVLTLQAIKDPAKRATALRQMGEDPNISRKELDELVDLQGRTPDEQDLELETDRLSLETTENLTKERIARIKFQRDEALIAQRGQAGGGDRFSKSTPVVITNPDGSKSLVTQTLDKRTGETTIQSDVIPGQLVSRLGESPEQLTARKIEEAGGTELAKQDALIQTAPDLAVARVRSKAHEGRVQENITTALISAPVISALNRNLELLEVVATGRPAAIKLKAKQLLGIETADEVELNNAIKKNVLGQLRDTFGAQFTEGEGRLLFDIEADFGKSTAGNIRLMKRSLVIMNDRVKRGRRAAKKAGDTDAVRDIDELSKLDIKLELEKIGKDGTKFSGMSDEEFLKSLK